MDANIALTMLGGTGSGKTSYFYAMHAMMSTGSRGFTFTPADHDDGVSLRNWWQVFRQTGKFPDATRDSKEWKFHASHGFRRIMGFTWYDYRGDALTEAQTESGVMELEEQVKKSNAIMLCIPGDHLVSFCQEKPTKEALATEKCVQRFSDLLAQFCRARDGTIPVVICVTKSDLCPEEYRQQAELKLFQEDWLSPLFVDADEPRWKWKVLISYVTLGKRLGHLEKSKNADPSAIDPVGVHLPVTYAIYSALEEKLDKLKGETQSKKGDLRTAEDRTRELKASWFQRWFRYGNIERNVEYVNDLQSLLGTMDTQTQQILRTIDRMKQELLSKSTQKRLYIGGVLTDLMEISNL